MELVRLREFGKVSMRFTLRIKLNYQNLLILLMMLSHICLFHKIN